MSRSSHPLRSARDRCPRGGNAAEALDTASRVAIERLERAVARLDAAGVPVEGVIAGDLDATGGGQPGWDPPRFDEVVVSCRPWLLFTRAALESGSAGT
jgi:hypothetical protein